MSDPPDDKGTRSVPVFLVLSCIEACGTTIKIPFGVLDKDRLTRELARAGWLLSVVSPPGAGRADLAPLCGKCAERVHPPELLKEARRLLRESS